MKVSKACQECRNSKRKCVLADNTKRDGRCLGCQNRKLHCSKSAASQRPSNAVTVIAPTPDNGETDLLSDVSSRECIELYFRFIHGRPHSLFHENTLWGEVCSGEVSKCLLLAICALSCRFSIRQDLQAMSTAYKLKASAVFATQLEQISLPNVQTAILLANLCAAEQQNDLEALYFGIANRMAYILGLHQHKTDDHAILREIKCRTWWSLYMADRWSQPGLGLPRAMTISQIDLDFPMEEVAFQDMHPAMQVDPRVRKYGLWRQKLILANMLEDIQDLNKSLVNEDRVRNIVDCEVTNLANRLDHWHEALPTHMTMSDDNLDKHRRRNLGGTFVALHLGYHHYSTLLYFQYLDASLEQSVHTISFAQRCRFHAMAFSKLLSCAREKGDCHVVYMTVAHMAMVSSSVLLHMLLFGNEHEVALVRAGLLANFEALLELKKYWSCMDSITRRLLTFQQACVTSRTYSLDKWLLRFLLEYGLPLTSKETTDASDMARSDAATLDPQAPLQQSTSIGQAFEELCS